MLEFPITIKNTGKMQWKKLLLNRHHAAVNNGLLRHRSLSSFVSIKDSDVVVVSFARTPIARFGGSYSKLTAPHLGGCAIKGAVDKLPSFPVNKIGEAFMGNVVSAGVGQAPARQAVLYAGLSTDVPCTTVNKVCASGMKAVMLAALSISSGYRESCIAGGMENMSNIPYYLPAAARFGGLRMGNSGLIDGIIHDGLWDPYNNQHMGLCGETCAEQYGISREEQDRYAIRSYQRAADAWRDGKFSGEVVPVEVAGEKKGQPSVTVSSDEEYVHVQPEKLGTLRAAFKKDGGTITAANSSKINDGAAAMILVSGKLCRELKLDPLFRIRGFGDAAKAPVDFTTAPAEAIPRALAHAGVSLKDIEYHEINEAFAVVPLVNARYRNRPSFTGCPYKILNHSLHLLPYV